MVPPSLMGQLADCEHPPPNVHAGLPPPAVVLQAAALAGVAGHETALHSEAKLQLLARVPVLHEVVELSLVDVLQLTAEQLPV